MLPMSTILEHVSTLFIVNATTGASFLKIILDAREAVRNSISASSTSNNELVVCAQGETFDKDVLTQRFVRQVLTVPEDVDIERTSFVLKHNGYLVIDVPFNSKRVLRFDSPQKELKLNPGAGLAECKQTETTTATARSNSNETCAWKQNQLDKHETTRSGNQLILRIPMDCAYPENQIAVQIVNRSVCVTATCQRNSTTSSQDQRNKQPYVVQRRFYKEYEASDCVPDPKTLTYEVKDNYLLVKVNVVPD
ncbi:unnamed protein product [Calicophoron daubneyi]|uniref:Uncharacterized protein n=1 Tax=Calicophoron daubneyi TaxID=300641 RepID=A0AAV2T0G2_CALDB